jgi:hypothetical protein
LSNAVAIAAGANHSQALRSDGTVVTWGSNDFGQTNTPADLAFVVALAAGGDHSLAIKASGSASPWIESLCPETNGQWTLTLQSQRGSVCEVLSSTNLQEWALLTTITNLGGRILWTDPATNLAGRFYRTRQPP